MEVRCPLTMGVVRVWELTREPRIWSVSIPRTYWRMSGDTERKLRRSHAIHDLRGEPSREPSASVKLPAEENRGTLLY